MELHACFICTPLAISLRRPRRRQPFLNARQPLRTLQSCADVGAGAYSAGRILAPSPVPDAWDSAGLAGAVVRRVGNDNDSGGTWAMWYGGRPKEWARADRVPPGTLGGFAGLAVSNDGLHWERVNGPKEGGAVLEPNQDDWWWFDVAHLAIGDVDVSSSKLVRSDGDVYFAYYSGGDTEVVEVNSQKIPGARTSIGIALSKDGEHWSRIEGEHPSGAVLEPGPPGAFDALGVLGPSVIRFPQSAGRPEYMMHYFAYNPETNSFAIGRALSKDGFKFSRDKDGAPVLEGSGVGSGAIDERGVSRCCVVRRDRGESHFVMFVEVVDGAGKHRIAMSESNNALFWSPRKLVLDLPDDPLAWDAGSVSHPSAVVVGDELWLYYTGRGTTVDVSGNPTTGIGVARSRGGDWSVLERNAR